MKHNETLMGNHAWPIELQRAGLTSLSHLLSTRRTFLEHVRRLDVDTPANKALQFMSVHHLVDLLTVHGTASLAVPGTSGSANSEMILPVP